MEGFTSKVLRAGAILGFALAVGTAGNAWAVSLKQVQVSNGAQVDLLFDGKISAKQIKTEFFNDIIQLSFTDTSVYPAKISTINSGELVKVFAYQYAPKLVRCRLTVRGNAETFKEKLRLVPNGKILTLRFDEGASDKVVMQSAQAARTAEPLAAPALNNDEQKLLERVMKSPEHVSAQAPLPEARPVSEARPLTGGRPLPSPIAAFGKLGAVLAVFLALALAARKFLKGGARLEMIRKFAGKNLGKKGKMIEVVSTHHLGPKKSIAVVRVAGRVLVLGISSDAINLITQISPDAGQSEAAGGFEGAEVDWSELEQLGLQGVGKGRPGGFSELLATERSKPATYGPPVAYSRAATPVAAPAPASAPAGNAVRAQIKNRLEGLKPL